MFGLACGKMLFVFALGRHKPYTKSPKHSYGRQIHIIFGQNVK